MKTRRIEKVTPIEKAAEYILTRSADNVLVVSNLVWREEIGRCFTVSTGDSTGEWHVDSIIAGEGYEAEELRTEFMTALVTSGRPLVIHDMGNELESALLCRAIWPGERIDETCKKMLAERSVN